MPQLIGSLLIFLACSAAGFSGAAMYKAQKDELVAFLRLISHIKARIEYCRAPLDSIFAEYTDRLLERCGFIEAALTMRPTDALAKCRSRLSLSDAQIDELMKFFSDLGCHTAAEESAHCAYWEKRVGELLDAARRELPRVTRLYRGIGILVGIMAAILLL